MFVLLKRALAATDVKIPEMATVDSSQNIFALGSTMKPLDSMARESDGFYVIGHALRRALQSTQTTAAQDVADKL